ncbi:MAG: prolyl oligopeptidase family serine peptidase [Chlamydiales bacterium]|nr:prolyl oligopeptidase family serine peptidase [Chlamydiales bacterium]
MNTLTDPQGNEIFYQGIGPEAGALPAFFYFALSGEESLMLPPYNAPAALLEVDPLRIYSMTIPGHGPGFDKFHAMQYWADQMAQEEYILEEFFEKAAFSVDWLIKQGYVDPDHLAVGGLSRGGFIATHLAARNKRIKTLLAFAPLTRLSELEEFALVKQSTRVKMRAASLDLEQLTNHLTHLHHIRFYIGNRDERVSTDACYNFIRKLAEKAHEIRARHMNVELRISHSVGHKGHGTAPQLFQEGVSWLKEKLR